MSRAKRIAVTHGRVSHIVASVTFDSHTPTVNEQLHAARPSDAAVMGMPIAQETIRLTMRLV